MSFPAALGVGIEGLDEVMEFDLADWVAPAEIERRLRAQLPAGLNLVSVALAEPHQAALAREVTYRITPRPNLKDDARIAAPALAELLARAEISVERLRKAKHKTVNLRPLILLAGPAGRGHRGPVQGRAGGQRASGGNPRRAGFRSGDPPRRVPDRPDAGAAGELNGRLVLVLVLVVVTVRISSRTRTTTRTSTML